MPYKYRKLQKEVSKLLRDHYYSFKEVVNVVGCGEKTMHRYVEQGIVRPVTSGKDSNSQYFDAEQLERAIFVYDCRKKLRAPVALSAGFYDYCKAKHIKLDLQNLLDRIESYRSDYCGT